MAECGCGRSPNGNCVGWHDLTEEQYLEKKAAYEAKQAAKQERPVGLLTNVLQPHTLILHIRGFVAQIGPRLVYLLPQTDLAQGHGTRYTNNSEAIVDCGTA